MFRVLSSHPFEERKLKNSKKKTKKKTQKKNQNSPPNFGPEATDIHVRLPVFTVHGNHDDPGGADHLSAVDMLSTARLVNYFGKQPLSGSGAGGSDACFNLFVLHQNRVYRGHNAKNAVPELALPDFLDFVVWGHEHECRPTADRGAGE